MLRQRQRQRQLEATVYTERYNRCTIFISWVNISRAKQWRAEVSGHEHSFYDKTYELALDRAKKYIDRRIANEDNFGFVRDLTPDDTRGLWTMAGVGISIGLLALLAYAMKPKPVTP